MQKNLLKQHRLGYTALCFVLVLLATSCQSACPAFSEGRKPTSRPRYKPTWHQDANVGRASLVELERSRTLNRN